MRLKESMLVLSLAVLMSITGCGVSNQRRQVRVLYENEYLKDLNRQIQVQNPDYRVGDYQEEVQKKEWREAQEGKGKWAGQYKSGKPVHEIPVQPGYNGYRSLTRGIKRGRH